MKKVLCTFIQHSQTGFIKGRSIADRIKTDLDLLDYTEKNNQELILKKPLTQFLGNTYSKP